MVDTIVLRVHDLREHAELAKFINQYFNGTSKNTIYLSPEESDNIRSSETMDAKTFIDYFWNSKTGGTHIVRYKSQEKINNSGHYYFHVFENIDMDYLEINLSIPKYLFGTNILMLCEHIWDKNFQFSVNSSLDYNLKRTYDLLSSFLHKFFEREFIFDGIVNYSKVEINRIDISFNQVFHDKEYALEYLNYQKRLRKKNLRSDSNSYRAYETSLMYISKRYSVKIYHKGTEYAKHDRKEHERINKLKGREYFDIEGLQQFADKMLRYEITFRDTMLSYLYNHKVFRKDCTIHKGRYEIYKKVESQIHKNDIISDKINSFKLESPKNKYIENHPYIVIDKNDMVIHKKISRFLNRNRQFLMKVGPEVTDFNSKTSSLPFDPRAFFSRELFKECARFFKSFLKDFHIKEKPSECVVSDRIDEYNSKNYSKLPKNEMLKFYALLQNFSFEDIMKRKLYSKATFYRYKQRFEQIGITQNNVVVCGYVDAPMDLGLYHHQIIYGKKLINS